MEEHHFRTHIFLSPLSGSGGVGQEREYQPNSRRPSVTLMKWAVGGNTGAGGGRRKQSSNAAAQSENRDSPTPTVSFSSGGGRTGTGVYNTAGTVQVVTVPGAPPTVTREPVTLATLNRDCFIIPIASLDRFLPAGVPMSLTEKGLLSVLEVEDPKLCVLLHLMGQMESIEPMLESPLARPLNQQKMAAGELLAEVATSKTALEGMLLANMEKDAEFPFIAYYVINKAQTDPTDFYRNMRTSSLRKFDPRDTRYTANHTMDLFNEVATIARPPLDSVTKRPHSPTTGYIISVYKVFEGDDGEKFEKNWLYWTGARMLYRYLPKCVGLRRITLHKSISNGDKMYLLLCECSNFLGNLNSAALLLPALRARLCGYTGLYKSTATF